MWPLCSSNMRAPFSLFPSHSSCFCWLKGESNVSLGFLIVWKEYCNDRISSRIWHSCLRIYFYPGVEQPCLSHGYIKTATTLTHLSIHSTNHCLVLYLSYTLSMTPSRRYSANVTYKLWAIFGETDHSVEDAGNQQLKDGEESQGKLPSIGKREQTPLGVPEDRSGWIVECLPSAKHVSYSLSTSLQFCKHWSLCSRKSYPFPRLLCWLILLDPSLSRPCL